MAHRTKVGALAHCLSPDPRAAARLARECGFSGLLFDAVSAELDLASLTATGRREFRQSVASQAQALIGLRVDLGARGLGPTADIDRIISRIDALLRTAADLQAEAVCVDLGPLPVPVEPAVAKPRIAPEQAGLIIIPAAAAPAPDATFSAPDPAFVSSVDTALAAIGAMADRYGTTVAFSSSLAPLSAIERALAAARCAMFGVDLDPVALLRDRWTVDEVFSRLGQLVRHVRARDAILGADKRTQPTELGRGGTDWAALASALDGATYQGWLTVDTTELPDRAGSAGRAATYLVRVFKP